MEKLGIIFKMGFKFFQKYIKEYILLSILPALISLAALFFVGFCVAFPNNFSIIIAIIALPIALYFMWELYLITYSLNYAAVSFIENDKHLTLKESLNLAKKDKKGLLVYLTKCSIVMLVILIPVFSMITENPLNLGRNAGSFLEFSYPMLGYIITASIVLTPFYVYLNQAYFFRKNDNFSDIFLSCYKNFNTTVFLVIIIIFLINYIITFVTSLMSDIIILILNLQYSAMFTFLFYSNSKINNKN